MDKRCSCEPHCDLFCLMATEMGVSVLHPGGYSSTKTIGKHLSLHDKSTILDLACGVGTTSRFLYKKYRSNITGVDINGSFIEAARKGNHASKKVRYIVADALLLPFPDNSFDSVIAQAFLVLIDDQKQALKEIHRVLKSGGYFGSLELSWAMLPTDVIYNDLLRKTCTSFIPRTKEYNEWIELFKSEGFNCDNVIKNAMTSGFFQMIRAEGIVNSLSIVKNMMMNKRNKERMMEVQKTFHKYRDYLGYGIYLLRKI